MVGISRAFTCNDALYLRLHMPVLAQPQAQAALVCHHTCAQGAVRPIRHPCSASSHQVQMERERESVLIVAHQAVLRALYGYFQGVPLEQVRALQWWAGPSLHPRPAEQGFIMVACVLVAEPQICRPRWAAWCGPPLYRSVESSILLRSAWVLCPQPLPHPPAHCTCDMPTGAQNRDPSAHAYRVSGAPRPLQQHDSICSC